MLEGIKEITAALAEIKEGLTGICQELLEALQKGVDPETQKTLVQGVVEAVKQALSEMPQPRAGAPLAHGTVSRAEIARVLGELALQGVSDDALASILKPEQPEQE